MESSVYSNGHGAKKQRNLRQRAVAGYGISQSKPNIEKKVESGFTSFANGEVAVAGIADRRRADAAYPDVVIASQRLFLGNRPG
jgi:hypothetical protein